jgi:hypothetical protein
MTKAELDQRIVDLEADRDALWEEIRVLRTALATAGGALLTGHPGYRSPSASAGS